MINDLTGTPLTVGRIEFGESRPFLPRWTAEKIREMNTNRCTICNAGLSWDATSNVCGPCLREKVVADKE